MSLFPKAHIVAYLKKTFFRIFINNLHGVLSVGLAVLLFVAPLSLTTSGQQPGVDSKVPKGDHFVFYRDAKGEFACREATLEEARELDKIRPQGLRRITHQTPESYIKGENATADNVDHLTIVLRATAQLDANPQAKAAFIRSAQVWESIIKSPVTIYIDVDFGPKRFDGSDWPAGTIGSTFTPTVTRLYDTVKTQLRAGASTLEETPLYNSLPSSVLPTDKGDANAITISQSIARAIGVLPATAPDPATNPGVDLPAIGFNSNFAYDFDSSNGISPGLTDFEAVATHEIGHALGFISRAGRTDPANPAIWDIYRFRAGTTLGTFGSAQRIMGSSGLQFYFSGPAEVGLSTGGSDGNAPGGDGNQSSHWKDDSQSGIYIGIMDPTIASGVHKAITSNDTIALDSFGYNLTSSVPPPPPPPPPPGLANNDFSTAQVIAGCTGSVTGTNLGGDKEAGEGSHSPDDDAGDASVWYNWRAPSNGSVNITTAGSNYDTVLAVYTGNSVVESNLTTIAKNDDVQLGVIVSSTVTFDATAGTVYRIAVDGWGGDAGNITLNWTQNPCAQQNLVQLGNIGYKVGESSGSLPVKVIRTQTSGEATVNYTTSDSAGLQECNVFNGIASSRCDYATSVGTVRFAAGEGTKTVFIPIVDDSYAEGNENLSISLSNAVGAALGPVGSINTAILDNDNVNGANPIDGVDFFIRAQYIDFLGREPEPAGLAGWRNVLVNCGVTVAPPCDRIEVSAGFFRSAEFQSRGYFIYRFYSAVGRIPLYPEFMPDFAKVSGFLSDQQLEANKAAFVTEFMARTEFQNKYSSTFNNPTAYVDALLQTVGLPNHPSRQAWINSLNPNNAATRAQVLRALVESVQVYDKYFNEAFVIMQYFGYLRRTADISYLNWIQTMNNTNGDYRTMIDGFLNSLEYRKRFGP